MKQNCISDLPSQRVNQLFIKSPTGLDDLRITYRKDPHRLGGTSVSVFGELLLSEVLSQEFLLTRFLSGVGDCLKSVVSLHRQKRDR